MKNSDLTIFENFEIRRSFDEENEKWYFSVIDVVAALTEQKDKLKARKYWNKLSERLKLEWNQSVTNCHRLKLIATDGKKYLTDVADVETILRLVQSVPSKKAEPIKLWLAKVWYERMEEISDPSKWLDRARDHWQKMWRSEKWIQQRMTGQETRNKLTDYWSENWIEEWQEFAILTNIIHSEWAWLSVKEHKKMKDLKTQNLRDHMSEAELIFTALAELSTRQISENENAEWMIENKKCAKKWWEVAKNAKKELENKTGKNIVTWENFLWGDKILKN